MSVETYYRMPTSMSRFGYALRHGYPAYAARGAGTILGLSLATALTITAGVLLIVGLASLLTSDKKQVKT